MYLKRDVRKGIPGWDGTLMPTIELTVSFDSKQPVTYSTTREVLDSVVSCMPCRYGRGNGDSHHKKKKNFGLGETYHKRKRSGGKGARVKLLCSQPRRVPAEGILGEKKNFHIKNSFLITEELTIRRLEFSSQTSFQRCHRTQFRLRLGNLCFSLSWCIHRVNLDIYSTVS